MIISEHPTFSNAIMHYSMLSIPIYFTYVGKLLLTWKTKTLNRRISWSSAGKERCGATVGVCRCVSVESKVYVRKGICSNSTIRHQRLILYTLQNLNRLLLLEWQSTHRTLLHILCLSPSNRLLRWSLCLCNVNPYPLMQPLFTSEVVMSCE